MAKEVLKKEYVYVDFDKNEFRFYNVTVLSVGYNQMQVIMSHGRLGNKGRENITRLDDYKEAMKLAYRKIYEKKSEGFVSKEKTKEFFQSFLLEEKNKKKQTKPAAVRKKEPRLCRCDACKKTIRESIYKKIEQWARGEGNWDSEPTLYNKVLCLDCQIEKDIFKKRIGSEKTI